VWWSTGQQPAQLLLDKEVVLATGWNGRFYDIIKKGAPVGIEWNEGALKQGSFAIPRGAKTPTGPTRCWPMMAVPQQQAVYASELGYPGLNLESLNFVDPKVNPSCRPPISTSSSGSATSGTPRTAPRRPNCWNAWMLKKG
jgi:putative spermidine/putrescine transport system substrate-binding protein